MTSITIVGEKLANKDEEFIFIGPQNDCKNCKLKFMEKHALTVEQFEQVLAGKLKIDEVEE